MRTRLVKLLRFLALAPLTVISPAIAGTAVSIQVAAPVEILTTADMKTSGLVFSDMPVTFRREANGDYVAFGAAFAFPGTAGRAPVRATGSYRYLGSLDHLRPDDSVENPPSPLLSDGRQQPSPDGDPFDRDYGGGGPVRDGPDGVLFQLYHGEYHCRPPAGFPAIGGVGLAVSRDGGRRFEKIGVVLTPRVSREEICASEATGGYWADAAIIEADGQGRRESAGERYDYLIFVDHNALEQPFIGLSLARASKRSVDAALAQRLAPKFRKYYRPASGEADFTQPALGGASTPILADAHVYIGAPGVAYDEYLKRFILYYQYNQTHIVLRFGPDLFHWSDPVEVIQVPSDRDQRLFYPSLVGLGSDPLLPGKQFYIYYLQRGPLNTDPRFMRVKVEITSPA